MNGGRLLAGVVFVSGATALAGLLAGGTGVIFALVALGLGVALSVTLAAQDDGSVGEGAPVAVAILSLVLLVLAGVSAGFGGAMAVIVAFWAAAISMGLILEADEQ